MSYEEDSRTPFRAECACGKGFLRYYRVSSSNDWGQVKEYNTPIEFHCDSCEKEYHYELDGMSIYLVPKGVSFPSEAPRLGRQYYYNFDEELVEKFSKSDIETIISDMTAPKHRYIKHLETNVAKQFVDKWFYTHGTKSLKPMIKYLQHLLSVYDDVKKSYDAKKVHKDKYIQECEEYTQILRGVTEQSVKLNFSRDIELENANCEKEKSEREKHKYDDFHAGVTYDSSYKKDLVGHYWDSYYIEECTDSEFLKLDKGLLGTPKVTISKKYRCKCQICGNEAVIVSSDLKILRDSEVGYYPKVSCPCHNVSSFEAKTMDILNQLGISYIREKSFDDLVGESGRKLRFDFALYKKYDNDTPRIGLLIELQGPHHYKKGYYDEAGDYITDDVDYFAQKDAERRLERQLKYDEMKKEYCTQHGISLECIKYTVSGDYDKLENKIIDILKRYGYNYLKTDDFPVIM